MKTLTQAQTDALVAMYANLDYSPEGKVYREIQDYCVEHGHNWALAPKHGGGLERLCQRCIAQSAYEAAS